VQATGELGQLQSQLAALQQQLEQQRADAEAAAAALREQVQLEATHAAAAAREAALQEGAEQAGGQAAVQLQEMESRLQEAEQRRQEAEEALRDLQEQASSAGRLQVGVGRLHRWWAGRFAGGAVRDGSAIFGLCLPSLCHPAEHIEGVGRARGHMALQPRFHQGCNSIEYPENSVPDFHGDC
jgi:hypothetical protein